MNIKKRTIWILHHCVPQNRHMTVHSSYMVSLPLTCCVTVKESLKHNLQICFKKAWLGSLYDELRISFNFCY